MRQGLVLTLVVAHGLAVAALVVAVGWTHSKPRPCRATFERVREGMTREEVEATVGCPPGDYTTPGAIVLRPMRSGEAWVTHVCWVCDEAELILLFDDDGRVLKPYVHDVGIVPRRWERLWSWLITGHNHYIVPYFGPRWSGLYDLRTLRDIFKP